MQFIKNFLYEKQMKDTFLDSFVKNYNITSDVSDFNFGEKKMVQDILKKNKKLAFSSTEKVICKEIGIRVSNEYGEDVQESFSWGFDQQIGYNDSTTISCGVPTLGEAKASVGLTVSSGSKQNWLKSNTKSFKSTIAFKPSKPGIYRIGKIVYKNTNVVLPFTAKLVIRATSKTDKNFHVDYKYIEYFLKGEGKILTPLKKHCDYSIETIITGKMKATFAIYSENISERISDI